MLEEGDTAPDVAVQTPDGATLPLSAMRGQPLVLFFYPKDDTSGCTAEALDFSALKPSFEAAGAAVLGVSKGTSKGKTKFIDKHGLTVPLATDADDSVCEAFGNWTEKSMYGRKYMGIDRSTFLVDAEGRVVRIWRKVKVPGHAEEVLKAAQALSASQGPHGA